MAIEEIIRLVCSADRQKLDKIENVLLGKDEREQKNGESETRLITQVDAAKRLNISTTSVWRLIKEGQLEVVNVRGRQRVRLTSLVRYSLGEVKHA